MIVSRSPWSSKPSRWYITFFYRTVTTLELPLFHSPQLFIQETPNAYSPLEPLSFKVTELSLPLVPGEKCVSQLWIWWSDQRGMSMSLQIVLGCLLPTRLLLRWLEVSKQQITTKLFLLHTILSTVTDFLLAAREILDSYKTHRTCIPLISVPSSPLSSCAASYPNKDIRCLIHLMGEFHHGCK